MTTSEIAAALQVSRQTVTRWIRAGRLQVISIKVGRRVIYRVPEREFRRFLREYVEGLE